MAETTEHDERGNLFYLGGWVVGGLALGFGLLNLLWSFGFPGGPLNQNLSQVGASGIDNLWLLGPADFAIALIAFGLVLLVYINAFAWKRTGGY